MEEFEAVMESGGNRLVVVMCCTKSCGPCRKFEPTFALFASDTKEALFVKINADEPHGEFKALCTELGVRDVPAFRLFRNGAEVKEPQLYLAAPGLRNAEAALRGALAAHV